MADLERAKLLKEKIEMSGGNLIAVSKKFPCSDIVEVNKIGVVDFGENYISEAVEKIENLKALNIRWHFIGRVQSGNLNKMLNRFYLIHSIYKLDHIKKINDKSMTKQNILLQVQHEKDNRGFGLNERDLFELIENCSGFEKINFLGLMFMPPPELEGVELKQAFAWASNLLKCVKNKTPNLGPWDTLSMGMSGDYEMALKEGATHVRIGTAIFGQRD